MTQFDNMNACGFFSFIGSIELQLNKNGKTDECAGVVQFKRKNYTVSVCNTEWGELSIFLPSYNIYCCTQNTLTLTLQGLLF